MYYQRDPEPLSFVQHELARWAVGDRFRYSLLVFCITITGPVLVLLNYVEFASEERALRPEPLLGSWVWACCVLLLVAPAALQLHDRAKARHWVWVYQYWSSPKADAFRDCMKRLDRVPDTEEQLRPLWLDTVKAFHAGDVTQLKELVRLLDQLLAALERRDEAQRQALRNKLVLQDTQHRIEALDHETEALQKELAP